MANAPLLSPLAGLSALRRRSAKISPFALAAFVLTASLFAGVALIAAFGDADGGQPVAVFAVDPQAAQLRQTLTTPPPQTARITGARPDPENAPAPPVAPAIAQAQPAALSPTAPQTQPAPDAPAARFDLLEQGAYGLLPKISASGETPQSVYARPFEIGAGAHAPTVSLIVGGLGLNRSTTAAAIELLPPEISLSFVPYARDLERWTQAARAAGHEIILEIPMEPFCYPANDPGPYTLLTSLSDADNLDRLRWLMSRFHGYFAVTNYLGAKYSTSHMSLKPFLKELAQRGVAYIDSGSSQRSVLEVVARNHGGSWTMADRVLDADPSPDAINEQLLELEALALQNGAALGKGSAYPATIELVAQWAAKLQQRGYDLAPASAIMRLRAEAQAAQAARAAE